MMRGLRRARPQGVCLNSALRSWEGSAGHQGAERLVHICIASHQTTFARKAGGAKVNTRAQPARPADAAQDWLPDGICMVSIIQPQKRVSSSLWAVRPHLMQSRH